MRQPLQAFPRPGDFFHFGDAFMSELTTIFNRIENGDTAAFDELLPIVYWSTDGKGIARADAAPFFR